MLSRGNNCPFLLSWVFLSKDEENLDVLMMLGVMMKCWACVCGYMWDVEFRAPNSLSFFSSLQQAMSMSRSKGRMITLPLEWTLDDCVDGGVNGWSWAPKLCSLSLISLKLQEQLMIRRWDLSSWWWWRNLKLQPLHVFFIKIQTRLEVASTWSLDWS